MTSKEWKALLAEPALLNLISALAALDRVYSGINAAKISYLWHPVPIWFFLIGFLVGVFGLFFEQSGIGQESPKRLIQIKFASYILLGLGVTAILVLVSFDAYCAKQLLLQKASSTCDQPANWP
jgi:hypothetical protein